MKSFLNSGIKIVISSDDPGFLGYNNSDFDFFVCAVAMEFDLKDFKVCVKNSIFASFLSEEDKIKLWKETEIEWEDFIEKYLIS